MRNKPETNRANQAKFKERRQATHQRFTLWVDKAEVARLESVARKKGWLNEKGRGAGQANMQQVMEEAVRLGLERLEIEE